MNQRNLLWGILVVVWLTALSGCASDSPSSELSGGPPPQTIGCWPSGLEGPVCGRLVSVSGKFQSGEIIDLAGMVTLSSSLYKADYAIILMNFIPCGFANSHIQIKSGLWEPETVWDTNGCIGATKNTPQWVYDLMENPFKVMNLDDGKVRFTSADAFVDYRWA